MKSGRSIFPFAAGLVLLVAGLAVLTFEGAGSPGPVASAPNRHRSEPDKVVGRTEVATSDRVPAASPGETNDARLLVLDEDGAVLDGAWAALHGQDDPVPVPLAGLVVPGSSQGKRTTVHAPGYVPAVCVAPRAPEVLGVALGRGRKVSVEVVDSDGVAIADVAVAISTESVPVASLEAEFGGLVSRPEPARLSQEAVTGADGVAAITGLPFDAPYLYCGVAKVGWIRTSGASFLREGEDRLRVVMSRLVYAAVALNCDDVASSRVHPPRVGRGGDRSVQLSYVRACLMRRLPEAAGVWVGVHDGALPVQVDMDLYSRKKGVIRVTAPLRSLTSEPEVTVRHLVDCETAPLDHGWLLVEANDSRGLPAALEAEDLLIRPLSKRADVWMMKLQVAVRCALPAGDYDLVCGNTLLRQAMPSLPLRVHVAAGVESRSVVGVVRSLHRVELWPRTDTGSSLTSFLYAVSCGQFMHQGACVATDHTSFRVPEGDLKVLVRHPSGGEFDAVVRVAKDLVLSPVLAR